MCMNDDLMCSKMSTSYKCWNRLNLFEKMLATVFGELSNLW
jgi:hypothetical protein